MIDELSPPLESWEKEVLANHRWGQYSEQAKDELSRLRKLWKETCPLDPNAEGILEQIIGLEICNWNLENGILALCAAIGKNQLSKLTICHGGSISDERWLKVWAYFLACRQWLGHGSVSGYKVFLNICDPDRKIQAHVDHLLGERNDLKKLYIERFSLCLKLWLADLIEEENILSSSHAAAIAALEKEIRKRDPHAGILKAFAFEGNGRLNVCHHKLFRRYDIILSSIGAERWRAAMPVKGTDGFDRADILEDYLSPIGMWIVCTPQVDKGRGLSGRIFSSLGKQDNTKIFMASLLLSLLRSQQLTARKRAESRAKAQLLK